LVTSLLDAAQSAGVHQVLWTGVNQANEVVSSGIYFCRLEMVAGNGVLEQTRKLLVVR